MGRVACAKAFEIFAIRVRSMVMGSSLAESAAATGRNNAERLRGVRCNRIVRRSSKYKTWRGQVRRRFGNWRGPNEETGRKSGGGNRREQRHRACGSEAAAGRRRARSHLWAQREDARGCGEDDWEWRAGSAVRRS